MEKEIIKEIKVNAKAHLSKKVYSQYCNLLSKLYPISQMIKGDCRVYEYNSAYKSINRFYEIYKRIEKIYTSSLLIQLKEEMDEYITETENYIKEEGLKHNIGDASFTKYEREWFPPIERKKKEKRDIDYSDEDIYEGFSKDNKKEKENESYNEILFRELAKDDDLSDGVMLSLFDSLKEDEE